MCRVRFWLMQKDGGSARGVGVLVMGFGESEGMGDWMVR